MSITDNLLTPSSCSGCGCRMLSRAPSATIPTTNRLERRARTIGSIAASFTLRGEPGPGIPISLNSQPINQPNRANQWHRGRRRSTTLPVFKPLPVAAVALRSASLALFTPPGGNEDDPQRMLSGAQRLNCALHNTPALPFCSVPILLELTQAVVTRTPSPPRRRRRRRH